MPRILHLASAATLALALGWVGPGVVCADDAPGAPGSSPTPAASAEATAPAAESKPALRPAAPAAGRVEKAAGTTESSTLRVSVDKVDQLINLVGELVITQAMLAQNSKGVEAALHQQMAAGLADLERNTRDLQESVMSIRMIPMSVVFNRFPRMLRDLTAKLGKKVEMVTVGEATELDKGLVEKITDPLTHLVRNSCDHGIELPAERLAKGKPETGIITLITRHQAGSIVIETRADGRGLNRQKRQGQRRHCPRYSSTGIAPRPDGQTGQQRTKKWQGGNKRKGHRFGKSSSWRCAGGTSRARSAPLAPGRRARGGRSRGSRPPRGWCLGGRLSFPG